MVRNLFSAKVRKAAAKLVLSMIGLAALQGCENVQTTQAGAVGITRKQSMSVVVSREQIDQQAAAAYSQLRQEASQKRTLNTDPALLARVQGIANRLIPQVKVYRPDAVHWKWEVNIFQSNEVNAFCMAGGKIAVYTGLIQQLKITDDELAAVMGHEIAHALREHVREQQTRQQTAGLFTAGAVIGAAVLGYKIDPDVANTTTQLVYSLPHSREAEVEADNIGLELAARAGYNPKAAMTLWQKMGALSGGRPPVFLSTHPSPESRAADLARMSQVVQPLYEAALKNQPKR
ncbi:MAG: M48 family metallopeptidase [Cytophagales bacterium]|nr:M48 family metallopeptidase [Cytophagales bacterium]